MFRLRHKAKITLTKADSDFRFGSDIFHFTLDDVLATVTGGPVLKVPFEDYQIPLVKVEMRPIGEQSTLWKGFGHTVPITDPRLNLFGKKTGLLEDPLQNFDGAKKWEQRRGFKRLLRPKPQLMISDLATANQLAYTWFSNQRNQWIPLQTTGQQIAPTKVNFYGLAYSYLQPQPDDMHYEAEITFYVKFRQFAWTGLDNPPNPHLDPKLPNLDLLHVCDGNCNTCFATSLDPDSIVDSDAE